MASCNGENSALQGEQEHLGKYGGIAPKKPLLSVNHERAYFDSADWVLGKQQASPIDKTAAQSLKPKMKRTPHHQLPLRKPAYTSGGKD